MTCSRQVVYRSWKPRPSHRAEVERAMIAANLGWSDADKGELGRSATLVSPHGVKGLEFDAVVVVEPAEIIESSQRGDRLLYIALTRATQRLSIVHKRPLGIAGDTTAKPAISDT